MKSTLSNQYQENQYHLVRSGDACCADSERGGAGSAGSGSSRAAHAFAAKASGFIAIALPPATFALVNASWSLSPAILCALAAAVGCLLARALLGERLRQGLGGLAIAAACAGVAALTGEARGYFLLQLLISGTSSLICVASVLARRPLAGILLNRVVGGPSDWRSIDRLVRVYAISTLVCAAYAGMSCAAQVAFYLTDRTDGLAVANVVDGPVWAVISMAIIVAARRSAASNPAASN